MMTVLVPNTRTFARVSEGRVSNGLAHWNFFQKSCDKELLSVADTRTQ